MHYIVINLNKIINHINSSAVKQYDARGNKNGHRHTQYFQVMGLEYDREWEPVYQAFLLLPVVQVALANPGRTKNTHRWALRLFILYNPH